MRTLVLLLVLGILVATFFVGAKAVASHAPESSPPDGFELRLSGVAQTISARPDVSVRCADTGNEAVLGYVGFAGDRPADEAVLAPKICAILARIGDGRPLPSLACARLGGGQCAQPVIDLAWAVSALAHESVHLRGVRDEAAAECYGLQETARAADGLGALPAWAAELEDYTYWNVRPPVDAGYFSAECKDGGVLDLHPASARWP